MTGAHLHEDGGLQAPMFHDVVRDLEDIRRMDVVVVVVGMVP